MKITDVRIFPYSSKKSSLVAFANVTFDKVFVVRNFRVFDGKNGLFAACPSEELKNGKYSDTAFPITKEFRSELLDAIVEAYEDARRRRGRAARLTNFYLPAACANRRPVLIGG